MIGSSAGLSIGPPGGTHRVRIIQLGGAEQCRKTAAAAGATCADVASQDANSVETNRVDTPTGRRSRARLVERAHVATDSLAVAVQVAEAKIVAAVACVRDPEAVSGCGRGDR